MSATPRAGRVLMVFVRDVVHGSALLAKRIGTGARRLYRRARHPGLRGLNLAAGYGGTDGTTPAVETSGSTSAEPVPAVAQETARAAARGKARPWTLDRVAGVGFFGWVGWCFTHRPIAAGWRALAPDLAAITPWAALWWLVAAWLAAQYDKAGRATPAQHGDGHGDAAGPDAGDVRAAGYWLWHLVCVRVRDAVAEGRRGVHLKALLDEPGVPEAWTVTTLREHCGRLGIPVKSMQIRGTGGGPTHGVHVDELTAALGRPLEDAIAVLETLLAQPARSTVPEGAAEVPLERAEEAPAGPDSRLRKRRTFEELLRAYFTRPASPTSTPGPTPLPDPSPTPPGRG
ncbi:hypothetical protein [Streptomyces cylindrosporus]|uniref:Uncharacterized protein n=1 Tax=Streptomyces cylindrosporus TaxID=2927583 RepID=A0ABS9YK53_9ACTN|nr:hypothetical protein [Streptomyces cylindrosporus]MCI3277627.1 hypothetical protein [Streptomyces cylindrosporus]